MYNLGNVTETIWPFSKARREWQQSAVGRGRPLKWGPLTQWSGHGEWSDDSSERSRGETKQRCTYCKYHQEEQHETIQEKVKEQDTVNHALEGNTDRDNEDETETAKAA